MYASNTEQQITDEEVRRFLDARYQMRINQSNRLGIILNQKQADDMRSFHYPREIQTFHRARKYFLGIYSILKSFFKKSFFKNF